MIPLERKEPDAMQSVNYVAKMYLIYTTTLSLTKIYHRQPSTSRTKEWYCKMLAVMQDYTEQHA